MPEATQPAPVQAPDDAAHRALIQRFTVRFLTPAFLGDAEQNGRWRTPPFKHALREWWRVAYAAEQQFRVDVQAMRRKEGLLFGNAWLSRREGDSDIADHRKSLVRLRLDHWAVGGLTNWSPDQTVRHPEVQQPVGAQLYLGYGPLIFRQGTKLQKNAAIQENETATFSVAIAQAVDSTDRQRLLRALWLMDRYGTLGGRSRNGWGSYVLEPANDYPAPPGGVPLRKWQDCLQLDWPHAIGEDNQGPLIWQSAPHADWRALMKTLAEIKIGLRTQFRFPNAQPDGNVHDRHWLSYPVTKHEVRDWKRNNLRLPNQLRFKVRKAADGKLVGIVFHMPHLPPAAFRPDRPAIERVWAQVHNFLDHRDRGLTRIQA
jgi:CRISPR-associated protein Cmr1